MIKIRQAIVVEGKYDQNKLKQIVDAPVFRTDGFHVMNDGSLLSLLRRVARERGLIILTDADGAGLVIRNYLKSAIDPEYLYHAYIPEIPGKEKRKKSPGKEGILGVEGMEDEIIIQSLLRAGAGECGEQTTPTLTKQDLYDLGLSGGADSHSKRTLLLKELGLPTHLSTNAMLQALQTLYSRDELENILRNTTLGDNHD